MAQTVFRNYEKYLSRTGTTPAKPSETKPLDALSSQARAGDPARDWENTLYAALIGSAVTDGRIMHEGMTRFHGVFAPNSKRRKQITPTKRDRGGKTRSLDEGQTLIERKAAMTWAKRLKRVFNIDIKACDKCGGNVRIIASIEDQTVIQKILALLDNTASSAAMALLPDCRACR